MNDWQAALKKILEEQEQKKKAEVAACSDEVAVPKVGTKKNRGRGAYPLVRSKPKVYIPKFDDDGEPEVFNWRGSPMER